MTPSFKKEIGARIKDERIKRNLRQKDCIKGLGDITIQMLSQWETGDATPGIDSLIKISEFYNVSIDYIITGRKEESNFDYKNYKELLSELIKIYFVCNVEINTGISPNLSTVYTNLIISDPVVYNFFIEFKKIMDVSSSMKKEILNQVIDDLLDKYNENPYPSLKE